MLRMFKLSSIETVLETIAVFPGKNLLTVWETWV